MTLLDERGEGERLERRPRLAASTCRGVVLLGGHPARSGGIALTEDYLIGSWVAKGASANCDEPDFTVSKSPGALVMEADISRHDRNAAIALGDYPRLVLDEPMDDLPMEARGPDGVAILRPATDAAYDPVSIGSATIKGDGVVFVKCSD